MNRAERRHPKKYPKLIGKDDVIHLPLTTTGAGFKHVTRITIPADPKLQDKVVSNTAL